MNESETLKKYLQLSSQQEVIRRRVSVEISPMTVTSPPEFRSFSSSPSCSPPHGLRSSATWSPEPAYTSTPPIPTAPGAMHQRRHSTDDSGEDCTLRLCEINQQMKALLTELLNMQSVRIDEKYRIWVQEQLLATEQQIRKQRRHSRSSSGDREMAASIATHFSPTHTFSSPWH